MQTQETSETPGAGPVEAPAAAGRHGSPRASIAFDALAAAVIDADRCIRCGTCVAACPARAVVVGAGGVPEAIRRCAGCSICWSFCLQAGLLADLLRDAWVAFRDTAPAHTGRPAGPAPAPDPVLTAPAPDPVLTAPLGPVLAAYEARARQSVRGAQDGGVVTALLMALLARGSIHGALVTHRPDPLHGVSVLATTPEQVLQAAGSVYSQSFPLATLARGLPAGVQDVALVGTPCQVLGLRALQCFPWRFRRIPAAGVTLTIGLFCTRSFDPERLLSALISEGIELDRVAKVDVRGGYLRAYDAAGALTFETKVRRLRDTTLLGCGQCDDFAASLADIAVGNVGSRPGRTTVLIRTARGAEAWSQAADRLDAVPLADLAAVAAAAERKRAAAWQAAAAERRAPGELWAHYAEDLAAHTRKAVAAASRSGPACLAHSSAVTPPRT